MLGFVSLYFLIVFLMLQLLNVFQLNKRSFKDLISKDRKKANHLPPLRLPAQARRLLIQHLPTVYVENSVQGAMLQATTEGNPLQLTSAPQPKLNLKHKPLRCLSTCTCCKRKEVGKV